MRASIALCMVALSASHGQMTHPPSRILAGMANAGSCEHSGCHWFSQGCQIGCSYCTDLFSGDTCSEPGKTMPATLNDIKLRTFMDHNGNDWNHMNPWRAPGFAPVGSPCGLAGGGPTYHPGNGAVAPKGVPMGADGRDLPAGDSTQWPRGSVQEVAWSITANHGVCPQRRVSCYQNQRRCAHSVSHRLTSLPFAPPPHTHTHTHTHTGGGYAYRLCPKSRQGTLAEACFQKGHLQFSGNASWIQYSDDAINRTAIPAVRTASGTHPAGSQVGASHWARATRTRARVPRMRATRFAH